jgi:hypothetical protein
MIHHCISESNNELLHPDVREQCPAIYSFSKLWALAFIIMYPIGIPIFSIWAMIHMGVHRLAKEKVCHLKYHSSFLLSSNFS